MWTGSLEQTVLGSNPGVSALSPACLACCVPGLLPAWPAGLDCAWPAWPACLPACLPVLACLACARPAYLPGLPACLLAWPAWPVPGLLWACAAWPAWPASLCLPACLPVSGPCRASFGTFPPLLRASSGPPGIQPERGEREDLAGFINPIIPGRK